MNKTFKLSLNFNSIISISGLIGFCGGVVATPFILLNLMSDSGFQPAIIIFGLFAPALTGLINGLFLGLICYPLYKFLTMKYGFKYTGVLYVEDQDS